MKKLELSQVNYKMKLDFISDPGHGWLKVPLTELGDYKPSQYSFKDKEFAYLEEDCDAAAWVVSKGLDFKDIALNEIYVEHFDRNRERF